jgi:hypothetical protein
VLKGPVNQDVDLILIARRPKNVSPTNADVVLDSSLVQQAAEMRYEIDSSNFSMPLRDLSVTVCCSLG